MASASADDVILSILSCVDVSKSRHEEKVTANLPFTASSSRRLLRLLLSVDGSTQMSCSAFEYAPLGLLAPSLLTSGAKVRVRKGTRCANGQLLLEPDKVDFLGGAAPADSTDAAGPVDVTQGLLFPPRFRPLPENSESASTSAASGCGGFISPAATQSASTSAPAAGTEAAVATASATAPPAPPTTDAPPPPPSSAAERARARAAAAAAAAEAAAAKGSGACAVKPPPTTATATAPNKLPPAQPPQRAPTAHSPAPSAAHVAPMATAAVDADLLEQLLASGLTLAEVHHHLGLPPPAGSDQASTAVRHPAGPASAAAAPSKKGAGGRRGGAR